MGEVQRVAGIVRIQALQGRSCRVRAIGWWWRIGLNVGAELPLQLDETGYEGPLAFEFNPQLSPSALPDGKAAVERLMGRP